MANKIKKGDTVVVITGADSGSRGEVLKVDRAKGKVVVEDVNVRTKHLKPNTQQGSPQGSIVEREFPIDISNVMLAEKYDARKGGSN